jgi:pyruvate dehydrogenase E2 component (dihydrolipoamide acetyltransferase)
MNAAARLVEVRVPDMGNFKDVAVIDVLVKPGERIEPEAPLVTLETEKATMDVPSTASGIIEKIHVQKGGTVNAGDLIATVRAATTEPPSVSTPPQKPVVTAAPAAPPAAAVPPAIPRGGASSPEGRASLARGSPVAVRSSTVGPGPARTASAGAAMPDALRGDLPPIEEPGFSRAHAGPSVRKFARELGVDLTRVTGHGFKGRITHDDVKAFVKGFLAGTGDTGSAVPMTAPGAGALPAIPTVDFAAFGPIETQSLSRIQRISGPRLHASWVHIPHVTQFDEADITELEDIRRQLKEVAAANGVKLTALAFIMRACVLALQAFPQFNASLDPAGANLILKKYVHIGFAADTPNGLVVPVVREADRKDVYELARQLAELSATARAGKLSAAQMQGGCFTISSLGGIGGTAFTPIINAPEVAILGVSRSTTRPVYRDCAFVPRLMLPLSLSYDHRVIDGATAARFTTFLSKALAAPKSLVEAVP